MARILSSSMRRWRALNPLISLNPFLRAAQQGIHLFKTSVCWPEQTHRQTA